MIKKILSIDGGGIKGVFPAAFLAHLEEGLNEPLYRYFDLITGTSTGGIIAIGLAMGLTAHDILELYVNRGPEIFAQTRSGVLGSFDRLMRKGRWAAWGPKYDTKALECALTETLKDLRIGDAKTRLMVPAWHTQSAKVYIFKTSHAERLSTDFKDLARDAAMATAAAPTFFREYITARDVGLVDGGIWANNPTGIAVAEGIGTLGWNARDIRVLSIGCLEDVMAMSEAYGAARLAPKLAGLFIAGQSHGSLGIAHILTGDVGGAGHKAIYRVTQHVLEGFYALDDTRRIQQLKSRAFAQARNDKPDLAPIFFAETVEPFEPIHRY